MKACCREAFEKEPKEPGNKGKPSFMQRLQQRWNARNIFQVILILCTFAIGGTLCGYLGRKILGTFEIEHHTLSVVLHIIVITILWPLCVIIISIPFGQFGFFRRYLTKLGRKLFQR